MKLRTTKKQKSNDYDIGCDSAPDQTHKKSSTMKTQTEKDGLSSNENSNLSNENEGKNRHKLRNSSTNYQGKYKKMNSGKYLYQVSSSGKRPPNVKKKQLRFIPNELVSQFKKFLTHLHKKDEENILNKKKKREEGKQKNKGDKAKFQNRALQQNYQNMNMAMLPYQQMEFYQNGFIPKGYIPQGYPMFYINSNRDYQAFPNGYPFTPVEQQKDIFNPVYLESLFKKEVVNHIVGAYYILHSQQAKSKTIIEHKKIVPISTVNLTEGDDSEQQQQQIGGNALLGPSGNNFNDQPIQQMQRNEQNFQQNQNTNPNSNPLLPSNPPQNQTMMATTPNPQTNSSNVLCASTPTGQQQQQSNLNQMANFGVNPANLQNMNSILTEPYNNINLSRQNQLNTVENVIKCIKENKTNEIIDKVNQQST